MVDRPIIFSGPMVRALLAGRKTQTRRLATSPLRRCAAGDRLYVRENFALMPGRDIDVPIFAAGYPQPELDRYENVPTFEEMRWTPCIHMPRRLSRLTLVIEAIRVECLRSITEGDARAEGLERGYIGALLPTYRGAPNLDWRIRPDDAYGDLWNSLHGDEGIRWQDNPFVIALTFRVERGNIDQLSGEKR